MSDSIKGLSHVFQSSAKIGIHAYRLHQKHRIGKLLRREVVRPNGVTVFEFALPPRGDRAHAIA
jgi:hypothetical protein